MAAVAHMLAIAGMPPLSEADGKGSIIQIGLHWDCNLRYDTCVPEFKISRLDSAAHGFNARGAVRWHDSDGTVSGSFVVCLLHCLGLTH